jgi:hypothetical protein
MASASTWRQAEWGIGALWTATVALAAWAALIVVPVPGKREVRAPATGQSPPCWTAAIPSSCSAPTC